MKRREDTTGCETREVWEPLPRGLRLLRADFTGMLGEARAVCQPPPFNHKHPGSREGRSVTRIPRGSRLSVTVREPGRCSPHLASPAPAKPALPHPRLAPCSVGSLLCIHSSEADFFFFLRGVQNLVGHKRMLNKGV